MTVMKKFIFGLSILFIALFAGFLPCPAENWVNTQGAEKPVKLLDMDSIYKFDDGVVFAIRYYNQKNRDMVSTWYANYDMGKAGVLAAFPYDEDIEYKYVIPTNLQMKNISEFKTDFELIKKYTQDEKVENCPLSMCLLKEINENTREEWKSYIHDVEKTVKKNWQPPSLKSSKRIIAEFEIDKEGKLLSSRLIKPSKNDKANTAALDAIKKSAPFRPFPKGVKEDTIKVQFTFDYNLLFENSYCDDEKTCKSVRKAAWVRAVNSVLFSLIYLPIYIITSF